jgi:hypothetical protein
MLGRCRVVEVQESDVIPNSTPCRCASNGSIIHGLLHLQHEATYSIRYRQLAAVWLHRMECWKQLHTADWWLGATICCGSCVFDGRVGVLQ